MSRPKGREENEMSGEQVDVNRLVAAAREVRRKLTTLSSHDEGNPFARGICVCREDVRTCDTRPSECIGPALRAAIRLLSDALMWPDTLTDVLTADVEVGQRQAAGVDE